MWKCCFSLQDPKLSVPLQKTHPNFKVDEFLRDRQLVWRYMWRLTRNIAGDEQTMRFKGYHTNKLRVTYKKEGEGFQVDAISNDGYIFTYYFCN